VLGQRLYLFYDEKARAMFLSDSIRLLAEAERKWPLVQRTLP
jgi:hypothetical protein